MTDSRFLLPRIAKWAIEDTHLFTHENCPFQAKFYEGDARVVVVVGENASGKSLLFRIIASKLQRDENLLPITISIRERTGSGLGEMSGMRRMFMFGDETEQSTGANSANVLQGGFHNAGRETPGVLMLDEPEIGLSDGYARAMGELIGREAKALSETCHGVVVVTHNRGLVRGIAQGLDATPTFICTGDSPAPLNEWVGGADTRTVEDLLNLRDVAGARRKITHRILHDRDR